MVNSNGRHETLGKKLHPRRFTEMSGKMAAIVGYVVGEQWTEPEIAELVVTGDGFVLARESGDIGCNNWVGSVEDLERNVSNLLKAAELTPEEQAEWQRLFRAKVTDWRPLNGHNRQTMARRELFGDAMFVVEG